MKEFTTTQLRRDCNSVYNAVQRSGKVKLKHRDREDMIIILASDLEKLNNSTKKQTA